MSDTTTSSIVQVLDAIVAKTISTNEVKTTSTTLLYKAGSSLTAIALGALSN